MSNEIVDVQAQIKAQLERQASAIGALRTTGSFITFKNANLKVDGTPIQSNTIEVVQRQFFHAPPGLIAQPRIQLPVCTQKPTCPEINGLRA